MKDLTPAQLKQLRDDFKEALGELDDETGGANQEDIEGLGESIATSETIEDFANVAGEMAWDVEGFLTVINRTLKICPVRPAGGSPELLEVYGRLCKDYGLDPKTAHDFST